MKKLSLFLSLLLGILLVSCKGSESIPEPTPTIDKITFVSGSNTSPSFEVEGGNISLSFTTTSAWTATLINNRAEGWCSVQPTNGPAGNNTITINVSPNEDFDEKEANIVVKSGTASQNISVSQKQKNALTLTAGKFVVDDIGGEVEVEIKANVKYSYTIGEEESKEWITYSGSRALTTSYLTFNIAENPHQTPREGTIVITDGTLSETVTIYQNASKPSIILTQKEYTIGEEGGNFKVEIMSNVDVEMTMPDVDWIYENQSRAYSTNTYHFNVKANEEHDNRNAEIIFRNKENNLEEKVIVNQLQKNAIVIAEKEYTIPASATQLDFSVASNIDFEVKIKGDWIKQIQSRGLTSRPLFFDIEENTSGNSREGTITFIGENIQQEIKVTQKGKDTFSLSTQQINISSEEGTFDVTVTSNMGYYISSMPDWITEMNASSTGRTVVKNKHQFLAAANPKEEERQGVIVFCNDFMQCIPVTVTQSAKGSEDMTWTEKNFFHKSLAIRFTADWCGYCPLMSNAFKTAQEQNPGKIEVVSMHCDGGLKFNEAYNYSTIYKVSGYPAGIIDGRILAYFDNEESVANKVVNTMQITESIYGTQTGISFESYLNENTLKVDVKLYIKKASRYRVTVLLLENNIKGYQADYTYGDSNNYIHNEIVRLSPSKLPGNEFLTQEPNVIKKFSYSGTVPEECNKENLRVLVFVEQVYGSQQKIATGDYGNYYVDNSLSEKVGVKAELKFVED